MEKKHLERFWSKVKIEHPDECWEWQAGCFQFGHGAFKYKGKTISASRFSYMINADPKELEVCHTCDNPRCVNPKHLYAGTAKQNAQDRQKRGRGVDNSGENNGCSKLTTEEVLEIRKLYNTKQYNQTELGRIFNIHQVHVSRIVNNKIWRLNDRRRVEETG